MATSGYSPAESISSLDQLKPGDHIKVKGDSSGWLFIEHHMLVVKVLSDTTIRVIHKRNDSSAVVEEDLDYKPEDITVVYYNCPYPGQKAIARARDVIGDDYNVLRENCEHFVTEAKTGEKKSIQVENAAAGLLGLGAAIGVGAVAVALFAAMQQNKKNSK